MRKDGVDPAVDRKNRINLFEVNGVAGAGGRRFFIVVDGLSPLADAVLASMHCDGGPSYRCRGLFSWKDGVSTRFIFFPMKESNEGREDMKYEGIIDLILSIDHKVKLWRSYAR